MGNKQRTNTKCQAPAAMPTAQPGTGKGARIWVVLLSIAVVSALLGVWWNWHAPVSPAASATPPEWAAAALDKWYGEDWRARPHYGTMLHAGVTQGV